MTARRVLLADAPQPADTTVPQHRTGCVVGVIRKVSGWQLPGILDEYRSYAAPKVRDCDLEYLAKFQISDLTRVPASRSFMIAGDVPFRIRGFLRTIIFVAIVLVIWVLSSMRISSRPVIDTALI